MGEAFASVGTALSGLGTWATTAPIIAAFAVTSTLSMALIQVIKDLTPLRRFFQEWWIDAWIAERATQFNTRLAAAPPVPPPPPPRAAVAATMRAQLIELATGGATEAFFNLPAEQLVAQMNAAAQIALDYPSTGHYDMIVSVLSEGVELADVALVESVPAVRAAVAAAALPANFTDARNRVGHRIQRNLDGLQIAMSDRWQWLMQIAAQILSIVTVELAIIYFGTSAVTPGTLVLGALVAMLSGYLAPVVRDLIAALQGLRK